MWERDFLPKHSLTALHRVSLTQLEATARLSQQRVQSSAPSRLPASLGTLGEPGESYPLNCPSLKVQAPKLYDYILINKIRLYNLTDSLGLGHASMI